MYKQWLIILICIVPLLSASDIAAADDDDDVGNALPNISNVLSSADQFRQPSSSSRVKLDVSFFKKEQLDRQKSYTVYLKSGRRSLALFNSPGEQGQKALQLDNRFYLLLPRSKRPVRISPMQKLLGEASIGDISNMTWSDDYDGTIVGIHLNIDGVSALKLHLKAKHRDVTYEQVDLWLEQHTFRPLQSTLYLKSGRIAKKVYYQSGTLNGKEMITSMVMEDRIQKQQRTVIHYQSIEAMDVPDRYFNPAYLTRNHVE